MLVLVEGGAEAVASVSSPKIDTRIVEDAVVPFQELPGLRRVAATLSVVVVRCPLWMITTHR
jgi:hypothetical protein